VSESLVVFSTPAAAALGRAEGRVTSSEGEFEEFFLANYDAVLHILTLMTGDRERATDATQEAFIKAYRKWTTVRSYDSPASWVRRIAINSCRDSMRSERRRRRREAADQPAAPTSHADQFVSESFARDLLAGLPRRQREVATLFYVDDRSINDIAKILGLNDGTVKFHLSQARDRLRLQLEANETPT
jgi:RNA polymerase sigma-70 factor, ECF subfamily